MAGWEFDLEEVKAFDRSSACPCRNGPYWAPDRTPPTWSRDECDRPSPGWYLGGIVGIRGHRVNDLVYAMRLSPSKFIGENRPFSSALFSRKKTSSAFGGPGAPEAV